jgi:hypothetical protein
MDKPRLLQKIRAERGLLESTMAQFEREQMGVAGVNGEWSAQDVLAHIAAWEGLMVRCLGQIQAGVVPDVLPLGIDGEELDAMNRRIYLENRDRTLDEVCGAFVRSYESALEAIEATSEEDLIEPGRVEGLGDEPLWHLVAANTFWHYREHREDLHAWLG